MKKKDALLLLDKYFEPLGYQRIWKDYYVIDLKDGNKGLMISNILSEFGNVSIYPFIKFCSSIFYDVDKAMGVLDKTQYGLVVSIKMGSIISSLSKESSSIESRVRELNKGRTMPYSSGTAYLPFDREDSYDWECSCLSGEAGEFLPIFYDRCCDWGFLSDLIMRNSWHLSFYELSCLYRKTVLLCLRGERDAGFELLENEYKRLTDISPYNSQAEAFCKAFKELDWDRFILPPELINPPAPKSSLLDNLFSK